MQKKNGNQGESSWEDDEKLNKNRDQQKQLTIVDSPFHQKYKEIVPELSPSQIKQINQQLNRSGFTNCENTSNFESSIIKVTHDSISYTAKFGTYEHIIHVFISNFQLGQIKRDYISCGQYAKTESFCCKGQEVVAKIYNINTEEEYLNKLILKEVFLFKIAGALGIAPKLVNLYGYDLVILKNRVQFLMEKCERRCLSEPDDLKELFKKLRKMHQIKLIHGDIKNQNIGWSKSRKQFLLYDFGLSKIIKQKLGHQTLCLFEGSYDYCSPEMKAIFWLKGIQKHTDLYYNDLYGILKSIEYDHMQTNLLKTPLYSSPKQLVLKKNGQFQWGNIVRYFQLCFSIYQENFQRMLEMYQQQKLLLRSFKKVILKNLSEIKEQKVKKEILQVLQQKSKLCSHEDSHFEQNSIDSYLYSQLLKAKNLTEFYFLKLSWENIEDILSEDKFKVLWRMPCFKKQLFHFLYLRESSQYEKYQNPILIKQSIFTNILKISQISSSQKLQTFRKVLIVYRNYFQAAKEVAYLQNILCIFQIILDCAEIENTLNRICQVVNSFQLTEGQLIEMVRSVIEKMGKICKAKFITEFLPDKMKNGDISVEVGNLVLDFAGGFNKGQEFRKNILEKLNKVTKEDQIENLLDTQKLQEDKAQKFSMKGLPFSNINILENNLLIYNYLTQEKIYAKNLTRFIAKLQSICPIFTQIQTLHHINTFNHQQNAEVIDRYLQMFNQSVSVSCFQVIVMFGYLILKRVVEFDSGIQAQKYFKSIFCRENIRKILRQAAKNNEEINQVCNDILSLISHINAHITVFIPPYSKIQMLLEIRSGFYSQLENFQKQKRKQSQQDLRNLHLTLKILELNLSSKEDTFIEKIQGIYERIKEGNIDSIKTFEFFSVASQKCIFGQFFCLENKENFRNKIKLMYLSLFQSGYDRQILQKCTPLILLTLKLQPGQQNYFFHLILSFGNKKNHTEIKKTSIESHVINLFLDKLQQKTFVKKELMVWSLRQFMQEKYRFLVALILLKDQKLFGEQNQKARLLRICGFCFRKREYCSHVHQAHILHYYYLHLSTFKQKSRRNYPITQKRLLRLKNKYNLHNSPVIKQEPLSKYFSKHKSLKINKKNSSSCKNGLGFIKNEYNFKVKRVRVNMR